VALILFDWGTYNALSTLVKAATLGMKLTEIPPYDFARRSRGEEYFEQYRELASKSFTTITAHAPYYNVVSTVPEVYMRTRKALIAAAKKARLAGSEVFNLHLGWRAWMDHRDIEQAAETVKAILDEVPDIVVTLEVMYTRRMLGTFEDIRAIMEAVGSDRVQVSTQLENAWMLLTGAAEHGNFEAANQAADEAFWRKVLEETLALSTRFFSLRFSQVIGFALGRRILKKRVPLGKGYPDLRPLARALADFMVHEVRAKHEELRMHLIYTGPPETKYRDTIMLYATIMSEVVPHLR
jgi:sugar phosphate isomerase/epimerase